MINLSAQCWRPQLNDGWGIIWRVGSPPVILCLCLLFSVPAAAEKRVALVVGNSAYVHVDRLPNPRNDAEDVAFALTAANFKVVLGIDLDKHTFIDKLREFAQALTDADAAVLFYAGHGMQVRGVNHLIPTDAKIEAEHALIFETVILKDILNIMEPAKVKIVFLDACRNNPFGGKLARIIGTRALDENRGLAIATAGLNAFIAYATQPGNTASDGTGRNSPFALPLKEHMATPGQSIQDLMIRVRNEVVRATNYTQIPWDHSALLKNFYFKEGAEVALAAYVSKRSDAAEAWGMVKNTTNRALLEEFLNRYSDTPFRGVARARLAELKQKPQGALAILPNSNLKTISLRPLRPSFDCAAHFNDAEVTICNNPELSMLDNEMDRLYSRTTQGLAPAQKQTLVAQQRQWLKARNNCEVEVACLIKQYETRIQQLQASSLGKGPLVPQARPSFDCNKHFLPAEVAVCNNSDLAGLDVDLDRLYVQTARGLAASRRRALVAEQRQWLRARDTCASEIACLKVQYQARLQQLHAWR